MEVVQEKPPTVQQVYNALRCKYGHRVAVEIMDSLEGKPEEYAKLRETVKAGKLPDLEEKAP